MVTIWQPISLKCVNVSPVVSMLIPDTHQPTEVMSSPPVWLSWPLACCCFNLVLYLTPFAFVPVLKGSLEVMNTDLPVLLGANMVRSTWIVSGKQEPFFTAMYWTVTDDWLCDEWTISKGIKCATSKITTDLSNTGTCEALISVLFLLIHTFYCIPQASWNNPGFPCNIVNKSPASDQFHSKNKVLIEIDSETPVAVRADRHLVSRIKKLLGLQATVWTVLI